MTEAEPKVFGMIMNAISHESKARIRADNTFTQTYNNTDVLELWKLIEKTHVSNGGVGKLQTVMEKMNFTLSQGSSSLEDYINQCNQKVERLRHCKVKLETMDLPYRFLLGLDKKVFGQVIAEWLEADAVPETYEDTKTKVMQWYRTQIAVGIVKSVSSKSEIQQVHFASSKEDSDKKVICLFCEKPNHSAQVCRKLMKWKKSKKNRAHANYSTHNEGNDILSSEDERDLFRQFSEY